MRNLFLLTMKPVTYAANVNEGDLADQVGSILLGTETRPHRKLEALPQCCVATGCGLALTISSMISATSFSCRRRMLNRGCL